MIPGLSIGIRLCTLGYYVVSPQKKIGALLHLTDLIKSLYDEGEAHFLQRR